MIDLEAFAAQRDAELLSLAERLRPGLADALGRSPIPDAILEAVYADWLDVYEGEGGSQADVAFSRLAESLRPTLGLTKVTGEDSQVDRFATWLATVTLNHATLSAAPLLSVKQWVTMLDEDVRESHEPLHGVKRLLGETFPVSGFGLRFPGEPVGPPSIWINCRCVVALTPFTGITDLFALEGNVSSDISFGQHDLIWYEGRRTPEVVAKGAKGKKGGAGTAAGKVVKRRAATAQEEKDIAAGRWVRVNRDGKKPGQGGYMERKSKVRPQNNALEDVVDTEQKTPEEETPGCAEGTVWDEDLGECVPVEDAEPQADDDMQPMMEGIDAEDFASGDPLPFWAVLAPEGVWSGDKRRFAEGALTHRDLPIPMMWQKQTGQGHDGSVVVASVREVFKVGNLTIGTGFFADAEDADRVIGLIADGHLRGVSVDVDDAEMEMTDDPEALMKGDGVTFTKGRISGATIVPIPAFAEAVIHLGEYSKADAESLLASAEGEFRDFDAEARKRLAGEGKAMPDGSFPIVTEEDLRNAIQAIGRAKDPAKAKAHIKKRARALGKGDLIPEGWSLDEADEFDADTEDFRRGPGWVTDPRATRRIHSYWTTPGQPGYAKIRWGMPGDFTRCTRQLRKYISPVFLYRTCAEWHHDALGYWPGELGKPGNPPDTKENRRRAARHANALEGCEECEPQGVSLVASSAPPVLDATAFANPGLTAVTPMTITEDGRIFGHLAAWDTCHVGIKDVCVTAPPSASQYAYFATGQVLTDDGPIPVGQITMDTGHADLSLDAFAAASHYDNTGTAVADVAVGDDEHGIWFAGMLRKNVDPDTVRRAMAAGQVSGDWRGIRGNMELVAALVVNTPGFPIPRFAYRHGVQTALVAPMSPVPAKEFAVSAGDVASEVIRRLDNRKRLAAMSAEVNAPLVAAMTAEVG